MASSLIEAVLPASLDWAIAGEHKLILKATKGAKKKGLKALRQIFFMVCFLSCRCEWGACHVAVRLAFEILKINGVLLSPCDVEVQPLNA